MCPWVETLGFCPYELASRVWHWLVGKSLGEEGDLASLVESPSLK